jgi:hypothetical protein
MVQRIERQVRDDGAIRSKMGGGLASRATQAGRVGGASGWWHRCGLYAMRSRAPVGVGTMALSPRRRCRGADRWP